MKTKCYKVHWHEIPFQNPWFELLRFSSHFLGRRLPWGHETTSFGRPPFFFSPGLCMFFFRHPLDPRFWTCNFSTPPQEKGIRRTETKNTFLFCWPFDLLTKKHVLGNRHQSPSTSSSSSSLTFVLYNSSQATPWISEKRTKYPHHNAY